MVHSASGNIALNDFKYVDIYVEGFFRGSEDNLSLFPTSVTRVEHLRVIQTKRRLAKQ